MIHSNPYSQIRNARRKDAAAIHALTTAAVRDKSLRARSKSSIESDIDEYFVYEIDGSLIGCCRLTQFPRSRTVELASVYVHPAYQGRRIGKALVDFAVEEARRLKKNRMVALTTQTSAFFEDTCGFQQAEAQRLPIALRESLKRSKRNSLILMREI
jgi:amino-acid N-acetyltransferase